MSAINSVSSTADRWTATSKSSQQIAADIEEHSQKASYTVARYDLTKAVGFSEEDIANGAKFIGEYDLDSPFYQYMAEQNRGVLMQQEIDSLGLAEQGRELKGMLDEAISRAGITIYLDDQLSIDLDANNRVVVTGKILQQDKLSALQEILNNGDAYAKKLIAYRENIKKGYEIEERWGQDLSVGKWAPVLHLNTDHSRDRRPGWEIFSAPATLFASDPKIHWDARPRENFIRFEGDENPKLSPEEIVRQKRQEYLDERKQQFDSMSDMFVGTYTVYR